MQALNQLWAKLQGLAQLETAGNTNFSDLRQLVTTLISPSTHPNGQNFTIRLFFNHP
jgi:hypothetical protein